MLFCFINDNQFCYTESVNSTRDEFLKGLKLFIFVSPARISEHSSNLPYVYFPEHNIVLLYTYWTDLNCLGLPF